MLQEENRGGKEKRGGGGGEVEIKKKRADGARGIFYGKLEKKKKKGAGGRGDLCHVQPVAVSRDGELGRNLYYTTEILLYGKLLKRLHRHGAGSPFTAGTSLSKAGSNVGRA